MNEYYEYLVLEFVWFGEDSLNRLGYHRYIPSELRKDFQDKWLKNNLTPGYYWKNLILEHSKGLQELGNKEWQLEMRKVKNKVEVGEQEMLNVLGSIGWDCFAVTYRDEAVYKPNKYFYFKRLRKENKKVQKLKRAF
ncbi:MAG: hypothetical protein M1347_02510 [Chloroflexi bacterium]|nr:hypothetical protein [Chloroflexota bacterium]